MKEWIQVVQQGSIYLQSTLLLRHGFKHAFFTKKVSCRNPKDLVKLISTNPSIHFLSQVHSNKVIHASRTNKKEVIKADSLISDKDSQSLWIYTADCIPILIGDSETGHTAAIHSGWKGLVQRIIKKTIEKIELNGCSRKNILVALGPAISGFNYQVDQEIISNLYESMDKGHHIDRKDFYNYMDYINCIKHARYPHKYLLDIRKVAKEQFLVEGICSNQISINSNCTFGDSKLFESWRRDHSSSRQWSFIESRNLISKTT